MNKLTILENGIIPVYEGLNGKENKFVDGRELHSFLALGRDFTSWLKEKIEKYEFIENMDYVVTLTKTGERQNVIKHDYTLTLDTAKEISMVENNEKGKQARKYFIEVEKKFKEIIQPKL
jgi:anti-repressor protein